MTKKNKEEKIYEIDKEALHKVIDHYVEAKNAKIKIGGQRIILGKKSKTKNDETADISEPVIIETPAIIINELSKEDILALATIFANIQGTPASPENILNAFEEAKQRIKKKEKEMKK